MMLGVMIVRNSVLSASSASCVSVGLSVGYRPSPERWARRTEKLPGAVYQMLL